MTKKTEQSFQTYFKRTLLRGTIIPITAAALIIFAAVVGLYAWQTCRQTRDKAANIAAELERTLTPYIDEVQRLTALPETAQFLLDPYSQDTVAVYERYYAFANQQAVGCDFYLLRNDGTAALRSNTAVPAYLLETPPYLYGLLKRADYDPGNVVLMLNSQKGSGSDRVFSIAQRVQADGRTIGFLVFEIDKEKVYDLIYTYGPGDIILADERDTVLLTSRTALLDENSKTREAFRVQTGLHVVDGEHYYVVKKHIDSLALQLRVVTNMETIIAVLKLSGAILSALYALIVLLLWLTADRVSRAEASSVDRMTEAIRRMQSEGVYTQIDIGAAGALQPLTQSYARMLEDIRRLVVISNEEQRRSVRAEIRQLEAQFDVHFMFNTLEVIRCLIKLEPKKASKMIVDFSALLRYSIDSGGEQVLLRDDRDFMEKYLAIADARNSSGLAYELDLEREILDCPVPRLIVQPMVENAVKYGARAGEKLHVRIVGRRDGDRIRIAVEDDGTGMSRTLLTEIRAGLDAQNNPPRHMGIYNIHRRIQLMYGKAFGVSEIISAQTGTRVEVTIPYVEGGQTNVQGADRRR